MTAKTSDELSLYDRIKATLETGPIQSEKDLLQLVEDRLPTRVVTALLRHGLTDNEIYRLVIPRRTLTHRKSRQQPLTREESERVIRIARITALAEKIFGDENKALRWLRKSKQHFDGRTPLELLATESGARLVEEMLYRIDEGMAA
jgi:putative toxin-antitoxin system antitoxin component (TIGR02293 family)